ncbi:hypothetical protein NNJEOMEG_01594 [Fundidesulfovibrio magnetotacticus]|uniref:Uncharacterized protein n=1 Tax=Fundidesulfovibrio magnetotacticus TaxID=2730080 RepID=A0A6V8LS06_9BACT|nr:hypothetical protein [Fundidesulfovibrio magnetotacticus]GFK93760.1 hypothetical protein NNJEOMEG_01594 [Fundidesulfovibrio magnetotacticus]
MAKKSVFLSYDFEFGGDVESLYEWLDEKGARECVNGLAFFPYEFSGNLLDSLRKDISKAVKLSKKDRLYVVFKESSSGKMKGDFLFGARKKAPWAGYAVESKEYEDVDA